MTVNKKPLARRDGKDGKGSRPDSQAALPPRLDSLGGRIDSIPDLLYCKDSEGFYRDCNRAFAGQVGLSQEAVIGRTDFDLYPPAEAEVRRRNDRLALAQCRTRYDEEQITFPDGRRVWVETRRTLCHGLDGQLRLIGISRELTRRNEGEEPCQPTGSETPQQPAASDPEEDRRAPFTYQVEASSAIGGTTGDIAERRQAELLLIAQRYLGLALSGTHSLQESLRICLDTAIRVSGLDSGGVYLLEPATGDLNLAHAQGTSTEFADAVRNVPAQSDRARLVMAGSPVYPENMDQAILQNPELRIEGIKSVAVIPIGNQGRIIGNLNIASHALAQIPVHGRHALEAIASQIGMAIANAQTEEALNEQKERFRLIAENVSDMIALSDLQGKYLYVSPSYKTTLGYDLQERTRHPLFDLVHPEDAEKVRSLYLRSIATETPGEGIEYRFRHADGHYVWLETVGNFIRGADGNLQGVVLVSRDITARKRQEEALRDSEAKYRALADFLPIPVFECNREGRITSANQIALETFGYTRKDLERGLSLLQVIVPENRPGAGQRLQKLMTQPRKENFEYTLQKKDGTTFTAAIFSAPIVRDEETVGLRGAVIDVTARKRAEKELLRKTALLEAQVEATIDGILVVDGKRQRILTNQSFYKIWKIPRRLQVETNDAPMLRYVTGQTKDPEKFIAKVDDLYAHPEETSRDEIECRNGTVLDRYSSPVWGQDGTCFGRIWTFRNITPYKQAVRKLVESQQLLADIIDFLPDATFVIDKKGKVIAWNRAIEEMTGVKAAAMIGKGRFEYALPFYGVRRPILIDLVLEPRDDMQTKYSILKKGKTALEGEAYMSLGGEEKCLFGKASALLDSRGKVVGAIESIRDISERKQTLKALVDAKEKYRGIFENSVMGIFQATPEGRIIGANKAFARILGYASPEEVLNSVTDMGRQIYLHPERRATLLKIMNETGSLLGCEVEFVRKDGKIVWVVVNGQAVTGNNAGIVYYEGMIQDITDRKSLEVKLRQAQKMEAIGTLAGGIAHDFNNILTAVIGYADMALREHGQNDRLESYLEQIYQAGKRAGDLVRQILAFSRQTEEKRLPLRVVPIVKEALKLLRASLPSTIEIHQKLRTDSDLILGNPTHIHQILMNLCTNAAYAMRDRKGSLQVALDSLEIWPDDLLARQGLLPGVHLRLSVGDTGDGIAPGILEKIYDPFFTTKKQGEGTGMGLSVVHGIVKSYSGLITAQSEVGKGAKFNIYLPLLREAAREDEARGADPVRGGEERILFVDDEAPLVRLGKEMLAGLGYQVVGRTSSAEALALFRQQPHRFDLVITDMTMPNMTGLELARELMLIRPDLPVILCTGYSEVITPLKAESCGLKDLLMKPATRQQLAASVRRALDGRGSPKKG